MGTLLGRIIFAFIREHNHFQNYGKKILFNSQKIINQTDRELNLSINLWPRVNNEERVSNAP